MRYFITILFTILFAVPALVLAQSQNDIWEPNSIAKYAFVHENENTIAAYGKLDAIYAKLQAIKHTGKGRVNIIHIGDSHLQADGITSVVRNGFQQFFGDAGRGLVFPYQLAATNAPHDIKSTSNTTWKSNRLTSPNTPVKTGISGYGIHSAGKNAFVNLQLKDIEGKQDSFDRMVFFLCNDSVCYRLSDSNLPTPIMVNTTRNNTGAVTVNSDLMLKGFELGKVNSPDFSDFSFYGVSLEKKNNSGVLYHTIGVNGARYDQFLINDLFWSQLKDLQGDLFIVSLGTNEAQNQFINEVAFIDACSDFVKKIHSIAPGAVVLLTTPAGSYFRNKKPNKSIQNVTAAINRYTEQNKIPAWDLFKITGGFTSIPAWKKYDLMSHDGVHYNNAGYQLQGALLLNAFTTGYNNYVKSHPYKAEVKVPKSAPTLKTSDIIVKADIPKKEEPKKQAVSFQKVVPDARPKQNKTDSAATETIGPGKRKSNIVVEYSD